jgi:hypothetical protein
MNESDSFKQPIVCHDGSTEDLQEPSMGCTRCGHCVSCDSIGGSINGSHVVAAPGHIRIFGPSLGISSRHILQGPLSPIYVLECKYKQGCHGLRDINLSLAGSTGCKTCEEKSRTLPLTAGCQPLFTGHFCSTCIDNYEMKVKPATSTNDQSFTCVPCGNVSRLSGLITTGVLVVVMLLIGFRNQLLRRLVPTPEGRQVMLAVVNSVVQPIRILVTWGQVTSQLGLVLDWEPPEQFKAVMDFIAKLVSGLDVLASAKCLGIDTFHYRWRLQVVLIPFGMMLVPIAIFAIKRYRRASKAEAWTAFISHIFLVLFFCYTPVCSYCIFCFIKQPILSDVSVLVRDDRLLFEDASHVPYRFAAGGVIAAFAIGVPLGAAVVLFRAYSKLDPPDKLVTARVSQAFDVSLGKAETVVHGVTFGTQYGFMTKAYKPKFYMTESIDMLRKLVLVGLSAIVDRGSVAHIMMTLCIAGGFCGLHVRTWPYKLNADNNLRAFTELHVCLTVATALAFRTELDSTKGAFFGLEEPDAWGVYNQDLTDRRKQYDWLLISTFILCVPGAFVFTCVRKIMLVRKTLQVPAQTAATHRDNETVMRFTFKRFQLGLATARETKDLADYIHNDLAVENEHERAGMRVWRDKQIVSHLSSHEMSDLLNRLEQELPNSQSLGFHFTDLDSAKLITSSLGIRASTVGQLGGGVSISLASLVDFGWAGLEEPSCFFEKAVGDALWASKWYEVMSGSPPDDLQRRIASKEWAGTWPAAKDDWGSWLKKLEAVLVVRVPSAENRDARRIVPGRDNVYASRPTE